MQNYQLQIDEVLLYQGTVTVNNSNNYVELVLTNYYVVIISKTKKLFKKEMVNTDKYNIAELKFYNNIPQIKHQKNKIELFFSNSVLVIEFEKKSDAGKFYNVFCELVTGNSISKRGAEKIKNAIELVDDTLGIDTIGAVKGVVEKGLVGTILTGNKEKEQYNNQNLIPQMIDTAKNLLSQDTQNIRTENNLDVEQQIETIKRLRELVDSGILSEEEFDQKKKQILNI